MPESARRLLFCALGGRGFVHPLIGIAAELRCRGLQSTFATSPHFVGLLEAQGFSRVPRGVTDGLSFPLSRWADPAQVAMQVKHIEYAIDLWKPDALVTNQLCLGPLIVAERLNVPVVVLGLATYLFPSAGDRALHPSTRARLAWQHADIMRYYNASRAAFNMAPLPDEPENSPLLGDAFLLQTIPEVLPWLDRPPSNVHFVGSCVWEPEEADEELQAWLRGRVPGTPTVYVQLSRSFESPSPWPSLRAAIDESGVFVAMSTSRMDVDLGPVAPRMFARPYVPQQQAIRAADAVIATGHTSAVLGAVSNGVPLLLLPAGSGSLDIAEAYSSAGMARVLRDDQQLTITPDEILRLVDDPRVRESARRLAVLFARADGASMAADIVEGVVSRSSRVASTIEGSPQHLLTGALE